MFRVVLLPIIRSAYNIIYSIWYFSHLYCYLPLSWKSWNRFECAVGGVRHPQHTQTVDTVVCAPDDGWKYHPKHVEQFPDINKLCNVSSCWIYEYIGIPLGAHPILNISRIRVNVMVKRGRVAPWGDHVGDRVLCSECSVSVYRCGFVTIEIQCRRHNYRTLYL
jgi:hypothetical protein